MGHMSRTSPILTFWRSAYSLSPDRFHALDIEALSAMMAALTVEDRASLTSWLRLQRRRRRHPRWTLN